MRPVKSLGTVFSRGLSLRIPPGGATHGAIPNTNAYKKVQDLQNHFLRDDGLLVWQKRGSRDRIPYLVSVVACIAGGACALYNLKIMAFPKKID